MRGRPPDRGPRSSRVERDGAEPSSPVRPVDNSPPLTFTYEQQLARNTGWQTPTQSWEAAQRRNKVLRAQTEAMANDLESHGVPTRRTGKNITLRGDVTGACETSAEYRAIRFLPLIAQRERAPLLNALRYFQRTNTAGKHLRLAVITTGQRVPIGGPLRATLQRLHRTISRWSSEAAQRFGIDLIYRGSEITVDAANTFHPHANVLYAPRKALSKEQWKDFLVWSSRKLGAHWKDCGKLAKPDEAIKYPFKPADLDGLDPKTLVWLHTELERLKIAQPLGLFAAFWRALDFNSEKIAFVADRRGGKMQRIKKQRREGKVASGDANPEAENVLITRTAPMPIHSPWWEPCSLIKNFTETPKTEGGAFRLTILKDRERGAREAWDANGAPDPHQVLSSRPTHTR
jgi:hypothetical protein